jgi:excisionase family DNA binding protein
MTRSTDKEQEIAICLERGGEMKRTTKEELVSVKEMARRLGIGATTAWSLIYSREIPAIRIKGAVRIRPEDIEKFKDENPY